MGRRISAATAVLAVVAAVLTLLLATVPALAHHKDEHAQGGGNGAAASQDDKAKDNDGDADSDSGTAYTEDDDGNDGGTPNNVPDEGDNAHPSGKDKSVENGGSGNQGKSESDPDDDGRGPDRSNGGPDKPNGSGGVDKADQDGNNGCGNDDDFEDDNEGWCGRKPKPATATDTAPEELDTGVLPWGPCVDESGMATDAAECDEEDVLGGLITRPATAEFDVPTTAEETEVLGERLAQGQPVEAGPAQRGASFLGQTLPFTGSALTSYAAVAVGLLLAGAGLLITRKRA